MAYSQMAFLLLKVQTLVDELLSGLYPAKFSLKFPIVLLGGPVKAYSEEMSALLDADIIVPEHADWGMPWGLLPERCQKS
jgi:hypothetical protein